MAKSWSPQIKPIRKIVSCRRPPPNGTSRTEANEGGGGEVNLPSGSEDEGEEDQRFKKKESLEDQKKEARKEEKFEGSEERRALYTQTWWVGG